MKERADEEGYEDLPWEEWHMFTGLPREAYEEWLKEDAETRRGIVGIYQSPDELDAIREMAEGMPRCENCGRPAPGNLWLTDKKTGALEEIGPALCYRCAKEAGFDTQGDE